jgi:hypothetical protein
MKITRAGLALVVLQAVALADDSPSRESRTTQPAPRAAAQAPARLAQLDSHGRYPFGQYLGGYRYPFSYPYYRNSPRRYPFGNGPYGPYGPNYGGYYSGNRYDAGVYGRPLPDAPPPPPDVAPPPQPEGVPPPRPRDDKPGAEDAAAASSPLRPVPNAAQGYGEPVPYSGGSMFNPSYGGGQLYRSDAYRYCIDDMWFGQNHLIQGFGYYPTRNYSYFYGPPSGFGFYGPEYMPSYYNYSTRNFGPYYPGLGGINSGAGFYQGW